MLQPEAANRQCRLVAEFGADLPPVLANAVQMKQVIQNLVRNAFDACADCPPERQVVTVTTRALDGEGVELCVHDAGTGIPQSVASRLFERFCTTKPDGLGIGLCLCRTIVRAHGGTLAGSNNPDGPGATFRMVLPVDSGQPDAAG
jgi:signal transduction histidine kinase